MFKPGSVNFSIPGGYFCPGYGFNGWNFNPCRGSEENNEIVTLHPNCASLVSEPGPGWFTMLFPFPFVGIVCPCLCCVASYNVYPCCFEKNKIHGIFIFPFQNQIKCEIKIKGPWQDELVVNLTDVIGVHVSELYQFSDGIPTVKQRVTYSIPPHCSIFETLHIYYRSADLGQIKRVDHVMKSKRVIHFLSKNKLDIIPRSKYLDFISATQAIITRVYPTELAIPSHLIVGNSFQGVVPMGLRNKLINSGFTCNNNDSNLNSSVLTIGEEITHNTGIAINSRQDFAYTAVSGEHMLRHADSELCAYEQEQISSDQQVSTCYFLYLLSTSPCMSFHTVVNNYCYITYCNFNHLISMIIFARYFWPRPQMKI